MQLYQLYNALADALDGDLKIEKLGARELRKAGRNAVYEGEISRLKAPMLEVLLEENAHPVCELIAKTPLFWTPPKTSSDPAYVAASLKKAHVELIGPDGLVKSDLVRLGLYGMYPDADYGVRTHPAEEVFVMLAGEALWKRGGDEYQREGAGKRSYHPSMLPHATRTANKAFMSVYVWAGDVSTDNYVYSG